MKSWNFLFEILIERIWITTQTAYQKHCVNHTHDIISNFIIFAQRFDVYFHNMCS